jgi:segregation and condensation protein A
MMMADDYEVKLEIFEGPMDLLLHLIHKNEVDIFDIPIATITDQYLAYLDLMEALNINLAGDFLVMASTLIHIKSRMLLPERGADEEGEDPRLEITRPLLEYMKFKEVAEELSERELLDRDVFARRWSPVDESELKKNEPMLDVNLFQLVDAFKRIVERQLPGVQLTFRLQRWTVKEKIESIISRMKTEGKLFFSQLFDKDKTIEEFVVTFLALLELVHIGIIRVFQAAPQKDIQLVAAFEENGEPVNG